MDVIALQKAMKAKKAMKELDDRLGAGVQDIHPNVKTRLEQLEAKDPHIAIANRASELEKQTAININKHNLRVDTILNARKYRLSDMVVDSFEDVSGIDSSLSSDYKYNASEKKIEIADGADKATVVTSTEYSNTVPNLVVLSQAAKIRYQDDKSFDLSAGNKTNTVFINGKIELNQSSSGRYLPSGEWESDVLDLGDSFKSFLKTNINFSVPRVYKESMIPAMTNATVPYGSTIGENYTAAYAVYKAFDKNPDTIAIITNSSATSRIMGYIFPEPIIIGCYSITSSFEKRNSTYNPTAWTFEGSNDGVNWTTLDERIEEINWSLKEKRIYDFNNNVAYLQYRINVSQTDSPTGTGTNYITIGEIDMYEIDYKSQAEFLIATSVDGVNFSSYSPINQKGSISSPAGRYVKIKAVLKSSTKVRERLINGFDSNDTNPPITDDQVLLNGQLQLKTNYVEMMAKDDQYAEEGTLLRHIIKKADFKVVEKIEVKFHG